MKSYSTFNAKNNNETKCNLSADIELSNSTDSSTSIQKIGHKGFGTLTAAVFITGEMGGSGILALPKAIVDSGGWIGVVLLVVFCLNACYGGICLGYCWNILEERYTEYRTTTRNPYSSIAFRAVGRWGSRLVSGCIQFTLFGAGTVYLLLSSQILQKLLKDLFPNQSFCFWFLIIALILTPAMWLGSPKDFWAVAITATVTTILACICMFSQSVLDGNHKSGRVPHRIHDFHEFFLAFGTLLFAFGGASTFPTIQNDMKDKKKFSTSLCIAFSVIMALYLPVTIGGYTVYGEHVNANVILSLSKSSLSVFAEILMGIHLVSAFLIIINPVSQEIEEILDVPHDFHWKRCLLRSAIVFLMVLIGETIPDFGKIVSLVGGSTITLLTFVLPPYFYMRLCSQKSFEWPERHIPFYIRMYLWELILVGLVGGTASTYSAILAIFGSHMTKPCFWV